MAVSDAISDEVLDRRVGRRVLLLALCFFPVVAAINAATLITDAARVGYALDARLPWILEFTSIVVIIALTPMIALVERRFPVTASGWRKAALAHASGSVAFSALHIGGMAALRTVVVPAVTGRRYAFLQSPLTDAIYEYRKDIIVYAVIVLLLTLVRAELETKRDSAAARSEARETGRLTLKSGGRTIYLDAGAVLSAHAAGNYVEIRASGRTHLPRISLAGLREQLAAAGVDVVQVHRSSLVNRAAIVELVPGGDGDFVVVLSDGSTVKGSRRYRSQLAGEAPAMAPQR